MDIEVWKDIPGYEGVYQVSDIGKVKSSERLIIDKRGFHRVNKEIIRECQLSKNGYYRCLLYNGNRKVFLVHQLVAMAFLGHIPNGHQLVVDHINGDKSDNRVANLRIITQRENAYTHYKGTSKHRGVCWDKKNNRWTSRMHINGINIHLGNFTSELEAHNAYQAKLSSL